MVDLRQGRVIAISTVYRIVRGCRYPYAVSARMYQDQLRFASQSQFTKEHKHDKVKDKIHQVLEDLTFVFESETCKQAITVCKRGMSIQAEVTLLLASANSKNEMNDISSALHKVSKILYQFELLLLMLSNRKDGMC